MIEMNFGKDPRKGSVFYNAGERIKNVSRYYELATKTDAFVDEITWNDLEMDQMFLRINHTNSFIGEQVLYYKLHELNAMHEKSGNNLEEELLLLSQNPERRLEIETRLKGIGNSQSKTGGFFKGVFTSIKNTDFCRDAFGGWNE